MTLPTELDASLQSLFERHERNLHRNVLQLQESVASIEAVTTKLYDELVESDPSSKGLMKCDREGVQQELKNPPSWADLVEYTVQEICSSYIKYTKARNCGKFQKLKRYFSTLCPLVAKLQFLLAMTNDDSSDEDDGSNGLEQGFQQRQPVANQQLSPAVAAGDITTSSKTHSANVPLLSILPAANLVATAPAAVSGATASAPATAMHIDGVDNGTRLTQMDRSQDQCPSPADSHAASTGSVPAGATFTTAVPSTVSSSPPSLAQRLQRARSTCVDYLCRHPGRRYTRKLLAEAAGLPDHYLYDRALWSSLATIEGMQVTGKGGKGDPTTIVYYGAAASTESSAGKKDGRPSAATEAAALECDNTTTGPVLRTLRRESKRRLQDVPQVAQLPETEIVSTAVGGEKIRMSKAHAYVSRKSKRRRHAVQRVQHLEHAPGGESSSAVDDHGLEEPEDNSGLLHLKETYKSTFGKSPKGPKANDPNWLKSKIEEFSSSEDEKTELQLMKEEFKKVFGKSPKGPKANNLDWLKSKIEAEMSNEQSNCDWNPHSSKVNFKTELPKGTEVSVEFEHNQWYTGKVLRSFAVGDRYEFEVRFSDGTQRVKNNHFVTLQSLPRALKPAVRTHPCTTELTKQGDAARRSTGIDSSASARPYQKQKIRWTTEEDELLRDLVQANGVRNWETMEQHFPLPHGTGTRTAGAIQQRWYIVAKRASDSRGSNSARDACGSLHVNDRVSIRWPRMGQSYPATIIACNDDETYAVSYDDDPQQAATHHLTVEEFRADKNLCPADLFDRVVRNDIRKIL